MHCMRFYARHPHPKFRNNVEKSNWCSCDGAIKCFTEKEQNILLAVYRSKEHILSSIYRVALEHEVHEDIIWGLVHKLESEIAKRRGLI